MLNPRIWPWFNLGLFFFGDSTLMRHSHRFPFFTTIFSVLLVISWFSDFNQIKPPDGLTFQTTLKQAFFEAVPELPQMGLIKRILYQMMEFCSQSFKTRNK
jgi:hypothetical protein